MARTDKYSIALAETIMKRYPDPDGLPYKSWSYSQGFILWGIKMVWEITEDKKYYDYIFKYIDTHVDEHGNIHRFTGESMDDMMAGSIIVWAYKETGLDKYKSACDKIRKAFDSYPRTTDGAFWHGVRRPFELWVDGLFMGQMFLAKYGKYIGDEVYCFEEAVKQAKLVYQHCKKDGTGLLYHAWSEDKKAEWADRDTGASPEVWSEGLGWYAMILVELLGTLPDDHPKRMRIVKQLISLLEELKKYQDEHSGLWYQVVDKGHLSDNWCDTSGSAMFVYTIAKSVEIGIAEAGEYSPVAEKGYKGMISKARLDDAGLFDVYDACDGVCVQKNYSDYVNYKKAVNAKEAIGAFLWAACIIEKNMQE